MKRCLCLLVGRLIVVKIASLDAIPMRTPTGILEILADQFSNSYEKVKRTKRANTILKKNKLGDTLQHHCLL
jgi:hypothetical protein